jgi:hypothetical protein
MHRKLLTLGVTLALGAAPAIALANGPGDHPTGPPSGTGTGTTTAPSNPHKPSTPGPSSGLPAKAKAYGRYCQGESKKHVAGTRGTPFSKCVTDMAKLAHGAAHNPAVACKDESKKHVAGQHGTPYSQCVSGGKQLLHDESGS